MEISRVTREDLPAVRQFYLDRGEDLIRPSLISWKGEIDGKIEGHAGFAFAAGFWIGFCDLNEPARAFPVKVVRMSYHCMDEAKRIGVKYLYVERDGSEDSAPKWTWKLGFRPSLKNPGLMRWRAKDWRA